MAESRLLPTILFVLLLSALGFIAGLFVGATFFVNPGDGLAGGAAVFVSGLVGGGVLLVASILLARTMPRAQLWRGVVIAILGLLVAALLIYQRQQKIRQARQQRVEVVAERAVQAVSYEERLSPGAPLTIR